MLKTTIILLITLQLEKAEMFENIKNIKNPKNVNRMLSVETAPFPCSASNLRERSFLKGIIFRDLEFCCENFVKSYQSCEITETLNTCITEFANFSNDFCEFLNTNISKYLCSRLLKSWSVRIQEEIEENYIQIQKSCLNIQICTKSNNNISDDENCLDFEGFPRKEQNQGFLYRVIKLENSEKFLLQSVKTLKCISNSSKEIYMEKCDEELINYLKFKMEKILLKVMILVWLIMVCV